MGIKSKLYKIKRLLSCLNRLKVTVGSLRLIGSEGDGTKHVLQTPTGKTIVMNLETGDAELVSSAGLKRIIRIIPTKGNSTIPLYTLNSITDTGKWIYKDEKGKDVLIESGVNTDQQKQEKPKFVFKLIPITPSPPLPDMIIEDLSLPEVCISPRKC